MFGTGEGIGEVAGDAIELLIGCGRASYADTVLDGDLPLSGMLPECSFSCSVALVLCEAGEAHRVVRADLGDKPEWHKEVNPKMETPGLRMAHAREWLAGTDHIIETVEKECPKVTKFSQMHPPAVQGTKEDYDPMMIAFALFAVHAEANPMRTFLLNANKVDPEDKDKLKCQNLLREGAREMLGRWESALKDKEYLCGASPGMLDCKLVFKLYTAYQLYESGLASLGLGFEEAAPLSYAYLERFSKRKAWVDVLGPGRGVGGGKLDLYVIRTVCQKFSQLCPELVDSLVLPALAKARRQRRMTRSMSSASSTSSLRSSVTKKAQTTLCL